MSTTRYIIEGNLVTTETIQRGVSIPLDDLLENLTAYQPLELGQVPSNLKAIRISPRGDRELEARLIVGHDPTKRHINYKPSQASATGTATPYHLQLPYTLFWIQLNAARTFSTDTERLVWVANSWGHLWSNGPYRGWDTPAWKPRFPNIFGDSRICFGGVRQDANQSLGHFVDASINGFWTSEFNRDLGWEGPNMMSPAEWARSETSWEEWSLWTDHAATSIREWFTPFNANFEWNEPVPQDAGQRIPAMNTFPTFNNLETWLGNLTIEQRERLIYTVGHAVDADE